MTLTSPSYEPPPFRRVAAVDLLRGLLMIIMALDHTRDFFSNATVDPTNPLTSWPALFFTRWITHLCAPGFVALAGTSVYLQRQRGRTANELAPKLATRGLWLMFVEVAIVSFALFFNYDFHFLQVIYAVGASMIILAVLQYLPVQWVAAYGLIVVTSHNLLDRIQPDHLGAWADTYKLLMQPGPLPFHHHPFAFVAYPAIPWSGIIALGYAFGKIVTLPPPRRRSLCLAMGTLMLATFTILRLTHSYGDPLLFKPLDTTSQSAMSFFQLTKYPPSLHYALATFGFLLLLFAFADYAIEHRWLPRLASIIEIYGRVPFFYYILHFFLIHLTMLAARMIGAHSIHIAPGGPSFSGPPVAWGFSLPVVYAVWFCIVASLYFPCKWFAGVKARRHDWWLSYL